MPSPSSALTTLRPEFGQSFEELTLATERLGFIGLQVCPVLEVGVASGTYGVLPVEQMLKDTDTKRAPGSGYNRSDWKFETGTYTCKDYGAEEPVDDREAVMYGGYFDATQIAVDRAIDRVLRSMERRIADLVFNTTTWTGAALTTAATTAWSTIASAVPITDVANAAQKVWDGTGFWPNALIINRKVANYLRRTAQIIDASKAQGFMDVRQRGITAQQLAAVFDLDYILISGSARNAAKEGQAVSVSPIWSSSYAMVCRIAVTSDVREASVGRTFHWGEDGSTIGGTIETYRDERVRSDMVRVRHDVDEKVMYAAAGHLITGVT